MGSVFWQKEFDTLIERFKLHFKKIGMADSVAGLCGPKGTGRERHKVNIKSGVDEPERCFVKSSPRDEPFKKR